MTRRRVVAGSWCQLDFQVDVTVDGRQVRFLNIIDEYTREALATTAARSFTADATIAVLDQVIAGTGREPMVSGTCSSIREQTEEPALSTQARCRPPGVVPSTRNRLVQRLQSTPGAHNRPQWT